MNKWNTLATDESIKNTVAALEPNGITSLIVENKEAARKKILELIPQGAEVMTMTSVTLDTIGVTKDIDEGTQYASVKQKLKGMDRKTQGHEMQQLGTAPEWAIGSVHAVTEDGHIMIASNTGSQLPAYAYGSAHVIWVVGTQKIVKNIDDGMKRIFEYVLPLESERAKKAYGTAGSNVSKLLMINKEVVPNRLTIIFVKEMLGF